MPTPTLRLKALDLLSRREHSRQELAQKLQRYDYPPEQIPPLLDKLQAENLLNDESFAQAYIRMRKNRGFGPERLQQELQQRGISAMVSSLSIRESGIDWLAQARQVRMKKFGQQLPADFPSRAKQQRFLRYRGFSQDTIMQLFE